MNLELITLMFIPISIVLALIIALILKPSKNVILAGFVAGLFVAMLDYFFEFAALKLGLWSLHGALLLYGIPISLSIGWIFLGFVYAVIYNDLARLRRSNLARLIYMMICIIGGVSFDYISSIRIGFIKFSPSVSPLSTIPVWVILVPLTTLVFYLSKKIFSK